MGTSFSDKDDDTTAVGIQSTASTNDASTSSAHADSFLKHVEGNAAATASAHAASANGARRTLLGSLSYWVSRINIVLHIAFGNLWEHTAKTLILGILITLGVMLIVCGNGFLESSMRGIERDFRANYSGDVFIHGKSDEGDVSLFGVIPTVSAGDLPKTPAIVDIERVKSLVAGLDEVESASTLIFSTVMLDDDTKGDDWEAPDTTEIPGAFLFAADYDSFWSMMGNVTVTEGALPTNTKAEIAVSAYIRKTYEKYFSRTLNVGDKITLTDITGLLIREVTVCGFFEPANPDSTIVSVAYCDANTARSMAELTYGSSLARDLSPAIDTTIANLDESELFGDDDDLFATDFDTTDELSSAALSEEDLLSILGDTTLRDKLNETDDGAWHFLTLRLNKGADEAHVIDTLNKLFTDNDLPIVATDWEHAAGPYASLSSLMVAIFTILVAVLAVVVFIVIMNTLIVSVIERTAEIGTMRAIGASRGFVRGMFLSESVMISVLASVLGTVLALIAIAIVNALHITVDGEAARTILGSGSITMIPTFSSIISTVSVVLIGSILANIYPVAVALRITPLKAMNQGQ